MINVHTFDGKLVGVFSPKKICTIEEKFELFKKLLPKLSPIAQQTVDVIMKDTTGNYQKANNVDASDILADILNRNESEYIDLLPILDEQLVDTKNLGICDSGRVTRLLQVWMTLE